MPETLEPPGFEPLQRAADIAQFAGSAALFPLDAPAAMCGLMSRAGRVAVSMERRVRSANLWGESAVIASSGSVAGGDEAGFVGDDD